MSYLKPSRARREAVDDCHRFPALVRCVRRNLAVLLAGKPPAVRLRLEMGVLAVVEAVHAQVHGLQRRSFGFLVTHHNAAARRGVKLIPLSVLKTLFQFGTLSTKFERFLLKRRIALNELLVLLLDKHAGLLNVEQAVMKASDRLGDQRIISLRECGLSEVGGRFQPGKRMDKFNHGDSPVVDEIGVVADDSTTVRNPHLMSPGSSKEAK